MTTWRSILPWQDFAQGVGRLRKRRPEQSQKNGTACQRLPAYLQDRHGDGFDDLLDGQRTF